MDRKLKTYSRKKLLRPCNGSDRLSSLPDELLGRILSILPTKDVAASVILCKRMRNCLCWISSIDVDEYPYLDERFPVFESFVDNILQKFSPPYNNNNNTKLTHFRLHFGGDINSYHEGHGWYCQPRVLPERLNSWISCPLSHYGGGLRELDLSFHVRRRPVIIGRWRHTYPCDGELPPSLFTCQSLQVLRLASNLAIDDAKIPLICFPNLKLLHLGSLVFNDDDFVARLVSSCPVLQDLSIDLCLWRIGHRLSISSPSIQSLVLIVGKDFGDDRISNELVLLNTPNLRFFEYDDNLAAGYSIAHMNALVKASIAIYVPFLNYEAELSLLRSVSHVQDLSVNRSLVEDLEELRDQLPVFHNLRSIRLDALLKTRRCDVVLPLILHRSPSLETLVFVQGLFSCIGAVYAGDFPTYEEMAALEAEGWRTTEAIPACCLTHLKQIVFKSCFGSDRELNTIKFLLANSLVLEKLDICLSIASTGDGFDPPNFDQFENALKDLPRASGSCLITLTRNDERQKSN